MIKSAIKRAWYPGSAIASIDWINYLRREYGGVWIYSDMNDFNWQLQQHHHKQRILDTFEYHYTRLFRDTFFEIIVISNHPGLHTANEIVEHEILQNKKPNIFILRTTWEDDLTDSLGVFENLGYQLIRVIEPVNLQKYAEFKRVSPEQNLENE